MRKTIRNLLSHFPLVDGMFRRHIWSRIHFPETELKVLNSLENRSMDVALDIGGALGSYAWVLNRKAKTVFCFEPGELHYNYLRISSIWSNVEVVEAAVGDQAGEANLYTPGDDVNARHSATLSKSNPASSEADVEVRNVSLITLDEFAAKNVSPNRSIDLLKIDVEGFENAVLNGAQAILRKHFPVIIAEIEIRHNPDYRDAFQMLIDLDYRIYASIDGRYRIVSIDEIANLQKQDALEYRISAEYDPLKNSYINNFVFQHEQNPLKVIDL